MKYKYQILLALFLIALGSSLIMSVFPVSEICDPGEGCDVVQHSSYASTFGIKNNYFGIGIFLTVIFLIFSHIKNPTKRKRNLIHAAVILGSLVALYFLFLQEFVLNAYCKYCVAVDLSFLAALVLIIFKWKE